MNGSEKPSLPPDVLNDPAVQTGYFAGETAKLLIVTILQAWGLNEVGRAEKIVGLAAKIAAYVAFPQKTSWPQRIILKPINKSAIKVCFGLRQEGLGFWLEVELPPDNQQFQITEEVEQAIKQVVNPLIIKKNGCAVMFKLTQ